MKKYFLLLALLYLLLILSCSGGGGSSGSSSSGGGSGWPAGDYNYLNTYDASSNNGIIVRWETPILVNTNGISGAEDSFRQWGLPFSVVNYNPSEGVTLTVGDPGPGNCAITYSRWYRSNGRMTSADIILSSDLRGCINTITHEAGHAIGFRGHTSDGGLMDSGAMVKSPYRLGI